MNEMVWHIFKDVAGDLQDWFKLFFPMTHTAAAGKIRKEALQNQQKHDHSKTTQIQLAAQYKNFVMCFQTRCKHSTSKKENSKPFQ